jgi:hypothetical protein
MFLSFLIFSSLSLSPNIGSNGDKEVFMWVGVRHMVDGDPEMFENIMEFASRHRIIPYSSYTGKVELVDTFLRKSKKHGIEKTWLEVSPYRSETGNATPREFAQDSARREATIERFKELARTYKKYYPENNRITIFDEAPLGDGLSELGENWERYDEALRELKEYGPEAFSYMYKAFREVLPKAKIGVFLQHPHNAPPEVTGDRSILADFMRQAEKLGATPDFIYSDVYRGYGNRSRGTELTNEYITEVVRYTKKIAEKYDARAYHLGQAHTIKVGYTPSRYEIDTNIDAILEGNPDGLGWYWPNFASPGRYRVGHQPVGISLGYPVSMNPFDPNAWGNEGPAGSMYGTSRDRFTYSYLRIKEAIGEINREDRFDLWLFGHDFNYMEHSVWLKSKEEGEWELIGHFNPQRDAEGYEIGARKAFMNSYDNRWHAVAFRGLKREKFLRPLQNNSYRVSLKVKTKESSDRSRLSAAYVMPYRPTRNYLTEEKITDMIRRNPRMVEVNSLVGYARPNAVRLEKGKGFSENIQVETPLQSSEKMLASWKTSMNADVVADSLFDLIVVGEGLESSGGKVYFRDELEWRYVGTLSGNADETEDVAAIRGIPEKPYFSQKSADIKIVNQEDGKAISLHGVYAVPHLELDTNRLLGQLKNLMSNNPQSVRDVSLGRIVFPQPRSVQNGEAFVEKLQGFAKTDDR